MKLLVNRLVKGTQLLPVAAGLLTLAVTCLLLGHLSLGQTGGRFVYPLDDTYIHLALAQQWAVSGYPGLSGRFEFAASSPLYVLLLTAVMRLTGSTQADVLAALAGSLGTVLALLMLARRLADAGWRGWRLALALATAVLLLALPLQGLSGMEHGWQVAATLALVRSALTQPGRLLHVLVLAAVAVGFRYEGGFVTTALALVALHQRRYRVATGLVLGTALAVGLAGAYAQARGGPFLPQSLLAKALVPRDAAEALDGWRLHLPDQVRRYPHTLLQLALLGWAAWLARRMASPARALCLVAGLALLAHLTLADAGGYRYTAYLTALALVAWAQVLPASARWQQAVFALALLALLVRPVYFMVHHPTFCRNIYHQQLQMAQLLAQYPPGTRVAVNDIGAIGYFTQADISDLAGIGDRAVQRLHRSGRPDGIADLLRARGVEMAVVHAGWMDKWLPPDWQPVAIWRIPDNMVCAGETVTWYAAPGRADPLQAALREMQHRLPAGVEMHWLIPSADSAGSTP